MGEYYLTTVFLGNHKSTLCIPGFLGLFTLPASWGAGIYAEEARRKHAILKDYKEAFNKEELPKCDYERTLTKQPQVPNDTRDRQSTDLCGPLKENGNDVRKTI